jgi:hypothetical protein
MSQEDGWDDDDAFLPDEAFMPEEAFLPSALMMEVLQPEVEPLLLQHARTQTDASVVNTAQCLFAKEPDAVEVEDKMVQTDDLDSSSAVISAAMTVFEQQLEQLHLQRSQELDQLYRSELEESRRMHDSELVQSQTVAAWVTERGRLQQSEMQDKYDRIETELLEALNQMDEMEQEIDAANQQVCRVEKEREVAIAMGRDELAKLKQSTNEIIKQLSREHESKLVAVEKERDEAIASLELLERKVKTDSDQVEREHQQKLAFIEQERNESLLALQQMSDRFDALKELVSTQDSPSALREQHTTEMVDLFRSIVSYYEVEHRRPNASSVGTQCSLPMKSLISTEVQCSPQRSTFASVDVQSSPKVDAMCGASYKSPTLRSGLRDGASMNPDEMFNSPTISLAFPTPMKMSLTNKVTTLKGPTGKKVTFEQTAGAAFSPVIATSTRACFQSPTYKALRVKRKPTPFRPAGKENSGDSEIIFAAKPTEPLQTVNSPPPSSTGSIKPSAKSPFDHLHESDHLKSTATVTQPATKPTTATMATFSKQADISSPRSLNYRLERSVTTTPPSAKASAGRIQPPSSRIPDGSSIHAKRASRLAAPMRTSGLTRLTQFKVATTDVVHRAAPTATPGETSRVIPLATKSVTCSITSPAATKTTVRPTGLIKPKTKSLLNNYGQTRKSSVPSYAGSTTSSAKKTVRSAANKTIRPSKTPASLHVARSGLKVTTTIRNAPVNELTTKPCDQRISPREVIHNVIQSLSPSTLTANRTGTALPKTPEPFMPNEMIEATPNHDLGVCEVGEKFDSLFTFWSTTKKKRKDSPFRSPMSNSSDEWPESLPFDLSTAKKKQKCDAAPTSIMSNKTNIYPRTPANAKSMRFSSRFSQTPYDTPLFDFSKVVDLYSPEEMLLSPEFYAKPAAQVVHLSSLKEMVLSPDVSAETAVIESRNQEAFARKIRETKAASRIQSMIRSFLALRRRKRLHARKVYSATRIQNVLRGFKARCESKVRVRAAQEAAVIQSQLQEALARKIQKTKAALRLQFIIRSFFIERRRERLHARQKYSATRIQNAFRGFQARCDYKARVQAAQEAAVIRLQLQEALAREIQETKAALRLQSMVRSCLVLRRLVRLHARLVYSAARIQNAFRGFQARCDYKARVRELATKQSAAFCIQSVYRIYVATRHMRRLQEERILPNNMAASVIQRILRGFRSQCNFRALVRNLHMTKAAVVLQRFARGLQARKSYVLVVSGILKLQDVFLIWSEKKLMQDCLRLHLEHKAAVTIQRFERGAQARMDYFEVLRAASVIQTACRVALQQKLARAYQRKRAENAAAVVVQRFERGHQAQSRYKAVVSAIWIIQTASRAVATRKLAVRRLERMRLEHNAAATIQRFERGVQARKDYFEVLRAASVIQTACRVALQQKLARAHQRKRAENAAAVVVQRFERGRQAKSCYTAVVSAIWIIQTAGRAVATRKLAVRRLERMRLENGAIVVLQRWIRGVQSRKRCTELRASLLIQAAFRANSLRKAAKKETEHRRLASRTIQKHWRCFAERRRYSQFLLCVTSAQRFWRGDMARKRLALARAAAISIQTMIRCRQSRVLLKTVLVERMLASTMIQTHWRGRSMKMYYKKMLLLEQRKAAAAKQAIIVAAEKSATEAASPLSRTRRAPLGDLSSREATKRSKPLTATRKPLGDLISADSLVARKPSNSKQAPSENVCASNLAASSVRARRGSVCKVRDDENNKNLNSVGDSNSTYPKKLAASASSTPTIAEIDKALRVVDLREILSTAGVEQKILNKLRKAALIELFQEHGCSIPAS